MTVVSWRTAGDYGVTWDEPLLREYGERLADYFQSRGRLDSAAANPLTTAAHPLAAPAITAYGPLLSLSFELWARTRDLPLKELYQAKHLFNSWWTVVAVAAAAGLAWRLGGPWAGLLAALFLALSPRFYGHGFNNPKDAPFAASFALGVLVLLWALGRARQSGQLPWFILGLSLSLSLLLRPVGLALVGLAGLGLALHLSFRAFHHRLGSGPERHPVVAVYGFCLALALAWGLILALWPLIQQHPLEGARAIFKIMVERNQPFPHLYLGSLVSGRSPWHYLPVWTFISQPPLLVLGAGCGLGLLMTRAFTSGRAWFAALRNGRSRERAEALAGRFTEETVLLAWVGGLTFHLIRSPDQLSDGVRYFLFLWPGMAVLAGIFFVGLIKTLCRWRTWAAWLVILLLGAGFVQTGWTMVHLHPFQSVYFSPLVGGLKGVEGRFELDYWAGSLAEASAWLNRYTKDLPGPMVVRVTNPVEGARAWLGPNLRAEIDYRWQGPAEFFITARRYDMERGHPQAPVIHQVRRQGVTLAVVKQLRPIPGLPWPPVSRP